MVSGRRLPQPMRVNMMRVQSPLSSTAFSMGGMFFNSSWEGAQAPASPCSLMAKRPSGMAEILYLLADSQGAPSAWMMASPIWVSCLRGRAGWQGWREALETALQRTVRPRTPERLMRRGCEERDENAAVKLRHARCPAASAPHATSWCAAGGAHNWCWTDGARLPRPARPVVEA